MIPEECRLDIYVDENVPGRVTQVEYVLAGAARLAPPANLRSGLCRSVQKHHSGSTP